MFFCDRASRNHLIKEFFTNSDGPIYAIDKFTDAKTVLDIGSNIGMFSFMALCFTQKARVIAIEPDTVSFGCLNKNVAGLPIETHNWALGSMPEGVAVSYSRTAHKPSLGRKWVEVETGKVEPGTISTPSFSFPEIIRKLDIDPATCFVKLDCESAEHRIFRCGDSWDALSQCLGFEVEIHHGHNLWDSLFDAA